MYQLHTHRKSLQALLMLTAALLLCAGSTNAQTAVTGGLRGIVTDSAGAAIPGAQVTARNQSLSVQQETMTDDTGRFTLLRLPPAADYEMTVSASGFRTFARGGVAVISSETSAVDMGLEVAAVSEAVDVTGAEAQLSQSAEISQIIDEEKLNELPLYNRNLNRAALLDPHVRNTQGLGGDGGVTSRLSINGRIYRETHYKLDGNVNFDAYTNNEPVQTVSLSAVQEYKVLTNQYAAEHGGTTAGFLIATTKSGTDDFHGEAFFFGRPSGIQTRPPLANQRIPNERLQFGGAVGGPIVRGKTFFFANYERTRQDRGSFISLPAPGFYVGNLREHLGLIKIDHRFTGNHTASVRLNAHRNTNNNVNDRITFNAQAAQQSLPSTAAISTTQSAGAQFNDTFVRNNFVNELRVSYTNAIPSSSRPVNSSVVITRNGISTEGNNAISNFRLQNTQLADQVSLQLGRHSLKFGGDYVRQKVRDVAYQEFGTYTFSQTGTLLNFQQQLGVQDLRYGQTRVAGFIQDDWRVNQRLTLNLGLRYDYQSIIDDYNNFGPRLGFAYDLGSETVIRGGVGTYYDQPFFHGFTQRYLQNAPSPIRGNVTLNAAEAAALFPNSLDPRALFPTNVRRSLFLEGEDIRSPYSVQFTVGVQRKLFGDFLATADYTHNFSRGILSAFNVNAPSPFPRTAQGQTRSQTAADATRPLDTYAGVLVRDVLVSVNAGNQTYNALALGVTRRFGNRYSFASNYVLSSAIDSVTDDHLGANPNEWSNTIGAERAPSDFNQRHRFIAYGTVALPFASQFAMITTIASSLRINPVTGVDNNGDGRAVDRPANFTRNSFGGAGQTRFDASLQKNITIGGSNESTRLELRADVFNLFNNSNFYRFNNVFGNGATPLPTFGQPIGGISNVDPGRQLQFAARLVF